MANSCPPCACHCVGDEGVGRIEMISLLATIGLALFGHWASVLAEFFHDGRDNMQLPSTKLLGALLAAVDDDAAEAGLRRLAARADGPPHARLNVALPEFL